MTRATRKTSDPSGAVFAPGMWPYSYSTSPRTSKTAAWPVSSLLCRSSVVMVCIDSFLPNQDRRCRVEFRLRQPRRRFGLSGG